MGLIISCCRRRKPLHPETEPLLGDAPERQADRDFLRYRKLGQVLGALRAGKYPSQQQVDRMLQLFRTSDLLNAPESGPSSEAVLSAAGCRFLAQARQVVEAVAQFGLEKNNDDVVQELLYYAFRKIPTTNSLRAELHIEHDGDNETSCSGLDVPSPVEVTDDITAVFQSSIQLFWLILSSAAFRLLLSDVVLMIQEFAATVAVEVDTVAAQVEVGATRLESVARADTFSIDGAKRAIQETKDEADDLARQERHRLVELKQETAGKLTDTFIARTQQIVSSVQSNPAQRQSLLNILRLGHKYVELLDAVSSLSPDTETPALYPSLKMDPRLSHFLSLLKVFLERLASCYPLDSTLQKAQLVAFDIANIPAGAEGSARKLMADAATWLETALYTHEYSTSLNGTRSLESLISRGQALFEDPSNSKIVSDIRALWAEVQTFVDSLSSDRSTCHLVEAIDGALTATVDVGATAISAAAHARDELKRDVIQWLLPRLVRFVTSIPFPRVEYTDASVDVAVDAFTLTPVSISSSLLPDHIQVSNWNEVSVDTTGTSTRLETVERVRVRIDGIRFAAENLGYFFRYKHWLGYEDQGVLSVIVGGDEGKGLSVDVNIVMRTSAGENPPTSPLETPLFDTEDITISIPGLHFSLNQSKNWLLNRLLVQPLAGPVVRRIFSGILQEQGRVAIDTLSVLLGRLHALAQEEGDNGQEQSTVMRYYNGLMRLSEDWPWASDEREEEQPQDTTATSFTAVGVVRTTVPVAQDAGHSPPPGDLAQGESVLAVGMAPQVVSDPAGPYGEMDGAASALERTGAAVQEAEESVVAAAGDVMATAETAGSRARQAVEVAQAREEFERRRSGWRSEAFTI
ncbi:hypothetical protein OF83DRAFT_1063748 [Amylostereum chailletii]|nr:hypothetical protein OF83DRAFT_1063748 [Amylostereum chailletii]